MALSVQKGYTAPVWAAGYINVDTAGAPVNVMKNIDSANTNNPNTVSGNNATEYTRACRAIAFQGYKPGANNNGMVVNSGYVYILCAPAGGTGNRADSGSIMKVLPPGGDYVLQAITPGADMFSPYQVWIDCDNNNDGALVTIYGAGNP
jgi:hypothetical protein